MNVSPLIGELDSRLELSEDKRSERWQNFDNAHYDANDNCDRLDVLVNDKKLWPVGCRKCAPALAEIQLRLRGLIGRESEALSRAAVAKETCKVSETELVHNTTILIAKAIEGYLAYRPPEVAVATPLGARRVDIFAEPVTRVDLFNQSLGEMQPPPGFPDINDGYGDPCVEDEMCVVRARPLVRPDLVKDITDSIQISDM